MVRRFTSVAQLSHFMAQRQATIVPLGQLAIGAAGQMLHREVLKSFGDSKLEDLATATQDDREKKGFTRNDPLLRNGELLRDSVEYERGPNFVAVGSPEPVAKYHEYGYVNHRTGNAVPPRPVFRLALQEVAPKVAQVVEDVIGVALGVSSSITGDAIDISLIP